MTHPKIGFIGLGLMGGNMAECLLKSGYELVVYGRNPQALARATGLGATQASTPKSLAEASDIVMLCVTTSEVVESLIYGEDGILAGARKGATVIDFGTSIPASTRKIGADLAAKGVGMVDAPLGRTPAHAKDGLLNIMAAGDPTTFETVKPVLHVLGENVFHLGDLGAGHATKLINNFMGMTTVCAMSQAFAIADQSGLDRQQLFDIMSTGPSQSPFMRFCKNYAVDGVSDLGFSIANASKDLGYFLEMVADLGTQSRIAEGTSRNLQDAMAAGLGQANVPEIFDLFREQGDTTRRGGSAQMGG